ncbi:MAG: sensor histidine kinase [Actinomycetota bacterium]
MPWELVAAAVLLSVGGLLYLELDRYLVDQRAARLRAQAKPVIDRRLEHLSGQVEPGELAAILAMDLTNRDTTATLIGPAGEVLATGPPHDGPAGLLLSPDRYRGAFDGDPHVTYVLGGKRLRGRTLVTLIPPKAWLPNPPAVVQLTTRLLPEERLLRWFMLVLAAGLVAVTGLGLLFERTLGSPFELLALAAIPIVMVFARIGRRRGMAARLRDDLLGDVAPQGASADFTEVMRRVEAAFLAQQAQQEQMRRFLTDSSHELRTPLASLGAAADVLLRGAKSDPEHVERIAHVIRTQADRMGRLVEDLLTLARIDSGQPLRRERVDLGDLARDAAAELSLRAPDRRVDVGVAGDAYVRGDPDRLAQVLSNLTSNALSHTDADGSIGIDVSTGDGRVVLEVTDDGVGMAAEEIPRIFERFYRADRSRSSEGFGLGLAIVREIVQAHDGSVEAASRPGAGTKVRVCLPPDVSVDEPATQPRSMPA